MPPDFLLSAQWLKAKNPFAGEPTMTTTETLQSPGSYPVPDAGPIQNAVDLTPIDRERLDLLGDLPDIPLFLDPKELERFSVCPSSVHTIETNQRFHTDLSYKAYTLKYRMDAYVRALEIYAKRDGAFSGKFTDRLKSCRKFAFFYRNNETGHLRVQSTRCKLRWCPICRDVSRMIVTTAVDGWLRRRKFPKMLTFTLKHSDDDLLTQINRIYKSFQKIRQRVFFKKNVTGGVWFFQLKLNPLTEQWHPHIHCLVDGKFLSQSKLKDLWLKITGDSFVVDVRPVKDLDNASTEVARYATSPADLTNMSFEHAWEVFDATEGKRICGTWGDAKGIVLHPTPQDDSDEWSKIADFTWIAIRKEYDEAAKIFWDCYCNHKPYDGPQLQPDSTLYKEELDFLLEPDEVDEIYRDFHRRRWRKQVFVSNFFGPSNNINEADNGDATTAE